MPRLAQSKEYEPHPKAGLISADHRDAPALYRDAACLLVRANGAYAAELVRKRAVSARLMGDTEAASDWARVADEVASVLGTLRFGPANPRRSA